MVKKSIVSWEVRTEELKIFGTPLYGQRQTSNVNKVTQGQINHQTSGVNSYAARQKNKIGGNFGPSRFVISHCL
ncbi:hypothetical protein LguiB_028298 [Lonicera macranthoides]